MAYSKNMYNGGYIFTKWHEPKQITFILKAKLYAPPPILKCFKRPNLSLAQ